VILERVLERSRAWCAIRNTAYKPAIKANDGSPLQPDVIIDLPDEKHLIIDSKVSLIAYERLVIAKPKKSASFISKAHVES
jgi:DNA recombination protein RmuC